MKTLIILLALLFTQNVFASGTRYDMRVDGLACPFCAFGIELKFRVIPGSKLINVDLNKGLVVVEMDDGTELKADQLKKLFNDSGFTYRSMVKTPIE